jgi:pyridoxine 5-phosphate synthase
MVYGAKEVGADRVELYTGSYANGYDSSKEKAIAPHLMAAEEAKTIEIGLNAGHDLNLFNLNYYKKSIDNLMEVSIGQALISDSLYLGLENAIKIYKQKLA